MDISLNSNVSLENKEQISFDLSEEGESNNVESDRDGIMRKLMHLYSKHNLSKVALEDFANLVNIVPGATVKIPANKYSIFKEFLQYNCINVNKHILCTRCKQYSPFPFTNANEIKCSSCNGVLSRSDFFFVHISAEPQLKWIVENYFNEIKRYRQTILNKQSDDICDVYDGEVLNNMRTLNFIYSLTINTDGLVMHKSSKASLYPVLMICNFLPPEIRFKQRNMIVAGLYYGSVKPNFSEYFDPIIREFKKLSEFGFFFQNENFQFHITHACFDLPMKSVLENIRQYNGYQACYYCEHTGKKTEKGVRYTNMLQPSPLRNHKNMVLLADKARKTGMIVKGIKGISPLIGFENFDIVRSLSVDYMHGALLGVAKNLLSFWYDSTHNQRPFYIKPQQRLIVNNRLASIKLCRFINRNITTLENYSTFKASQYRTFILYLFPVLHGVLRKKYFEHFQLFSFSMYTLLQEKITKNELMLVDVQLKKFVDEYEILYGETSMTMNVHCLLHVVECVKNLGPLWAHSMFSFESYNGTLTKYGKSPNNVLNQVVEKVVLNFAEAKDAEKQRKDLIFSHLSSEQISNSDTNLLRINRILSTKFYAAMRRGSIVFTSINYTCAKKTIDYFIETRQNEYGKIVCYVENHAMIEEYSIVNCANQILTVKTTSKKILRPTSDIVAKCIYLKIGQNEYIVKRPNKYEVN